MVTIVALTSLAVQANALIKRRGKSVKSKVGCLSQAREIPETFITDMLSPLRIGVLLDSLDVPAWEYRLIEMILQGNYASIETIIVNMGIPPRPPWHVRLRRHRKHLIYFLYTKLDEIIFRPTPNAFALKNLRELLPDTPTLFVQPVQKRYDDYFSQDDIDRVEALQLDVLIRFGFRIFKGKILTTAKYGIWSYHHGDNRVNRGGPAGVWEVFREMPETGVTLQRLTERLDGGIVLYRSWTRTYPFSPIVNKNGFYWTATSFLARMLALLHRVGEQEFSRQVAPLQPAWDAYQYRLYRTPSNWEAWRFAWKQCGKICWSYCKRAWQREQWFLLFAIADDVVMIFWRFKKILPPKDRFWADPHVICRDDRYYVFLEEYLYASGKGHLSVMTIERNGQWTTPVKVLEKATHLSYPFVFEWDGHTYMMPESYEDRTISLYECRRFPDEWEHRLNFMEHVSAVDSTLFYYHDTWWLFTTIIEHDGGGLDNELFLFYSKQLFSTNWQPHPLNPIVSDVKNARSAGKIFVKDGKIYRPSQDGSRCYGNGFNLNEIITLTTTDYREQTVVSVHPEWDEQIKGVHTFTYQNGLTIIDGMMNRLKISSFT